MDKHISAPMVDVKSFKLYVFLLLGYYTRLGYEVCVYLDIITLLASMMFFIDVAFPLCCDPSNIQISTRAWIKKILTCRPVKTVGRVGFMSGSVMSHVWVGSLLVTSRKYLP